MRLKFVRYPAIHQLPPLLSKKLRINIDHGLGCILLYRPVFMYLLTHGLVSSIEYSMEKTGLRKEYPPIFQEQTLFLARLLLDHPNILQVESVLDGPQFDVCRLAVEYNIPTPLPIDNSPIRSTSPPIVSGVYVTLNVKVGLPHKYNFTYVIELLIAVLMKCPFPIVLTGERKLTPCTEYDIHKDHFFSIYSHVIERIPNVIDQTYDETVNANTIECIRKSANIYQHAKYNIAINASGGLSFVCYFGNVIALSPADAPAVRILELPNSFISLSMTLFLGHLMTVFGASVESDIPDL